MQHKQKRIRIGGGKRINVDEEIADVIQTLNKNGYETLLSCQNNFGKVWIEFTLQAAHDLQKGIRTHSEIDSADFLWLMDLEWQYREILGGDSVAFRMPIENLGKFKIILKVIHKGSK